MTIVKIHCPLVVAKMKEYSTLRMYLNSFTVEGEFIYSPIDSHMGRTSIGLIDALKDWLFNENYLYKNTINGVRRVDEGDAHKFFAEHPEGFTYKVVSHVTF